MLAESLIEALEKFQKLQLSKSVAAIAERILTDLQTNEVTSEIKKYFKDVDKIDAYIKSGAQNGEPFTQFDLEPDSITQIKKIINALYHAHLALLDIEKMNIRDLKKGHSNALLVWQHTMEEVYQASYLFTHLDIDLNDIFGKEINTILPLISQFEAFLNTHSSETKKITEAIKSYPISHNLGLACGTALQQMKPQGGAFDYKFLTDFSENLPKHIKDMSDYLDQFSNALVKKEPGLNKEKIEELKEVAKKLLHDLEHLKGNSLFVSLKFLNYIHIVRSIISLSMSTLEQVGNLSDSSQDLIRDNLSLLKYSLLPQLFAVVDKIEVHALLQPGTLSLPLMAQIKTLYALIVNYAGKPVDFRIKGEELLTNEATNFSIEDSRFIEARLNGINQNINAAKKAINKIKQAQKACIEFFKIIEKPDYKKLTINEISHEPTPNDDSDFEKALEYYKLFKPYMMQVDIDQNDAIIEALTNSQSWLDKTRKGRFIKADPLTFISSIVSIKTKVLNLIAKKLATHNFHITLNTNIGNFIQEHADFVLFTYRGKTDLLSVDESALVKSAEPSFFKIDHGDKIVADIRKLTSEQAYNLSEHYRNKKQSLEQARDAYNQFIQLLKEHKATRELNGKSVLALEQLNDKVKVECKQLYRKFQPYFISGVLPGSLDTAIAFDKYFVTCLNNVNEKTAIDLFVPLDDLFKPLDTHFQHYLTTVDLKWGKKESKYLLESNIRYDAESRETKLKKDVIDGARQHYVIQHTRYSKFVKEFRISLLQLNVFFNESMQKALIPQKTGTPFPELENSFAILSEAKSVVALKQIYNSLYYIEQILVQLEQLNNKSWRYTYVYQLFGAYSHLLNLYTALKNLATDPHVQLITNDLLNKAQTILATVQEHSEPYQTGPETVSAEPIQFAGLWYSLNAFYVSPKHIRALRNTNYLTITELNQLHRQAKNASVTIEYLIKNSNSYFKLFLHTPNMLHLYRELVEKLNEFISTSHDTAINNLDQFYPKIFSPMLLEADHWEQTLGLKSGILSQPLQNIIDEYYKALLTPLKLKSKQHIDLAYDQESLKQRINRVTAIVTDSKERLNKLEKQYEPIKHLHAVIKRYDLALPSSTWGVQSATNTLTALGLMNPKEDLDKIKQELIAAYRVALPQLVKMTQRIEPITSKADRQLDSLLNAATNEYDAKLTHIRELALAGDCYYAGLKATEEMKRNSAQEKLQYLGELTTTHEKSKQQFIEDYTVKSFDTQVESLSQCYIGLHQIHSEYQQHLKTYLLSFKKELVQQTKMTSDIDRAIETALKVKIRFFEKQHFTKYYHLEMVHKALLAFAAYFDKSNFAIKEQRSLFESEETLEAKVNLVTKLRQTAEDKTKPVDIRLKEITSEVDINFKRIILEHKKVEPFTYNFLVLLISALLEALNLYTPPAQKLYNKLHTAVVTKPQLENLTKYYGLFSAQKTVADVNPVPVAATPAPAA